MALSSRICFDKDVIGRHATGSFLDVWLDVRSQTTVGDEINLAAKQLLQIFTKPHEVVEGRIIELDKEINVALWCLPPRGVGTKQSNLPDRESLQSILMLLQRCDDLP